jgi:lipopolysaccharide export system protein LptA
MKSTLLPCYAALLLVSSPVLAERADRDKPAHLEASRVTVDDIKRIHVFDGEVVLSQGTLSLRAARMVVTQDTEGYQKVLATNGEGSLVRFRQKREGKEEYVEGEAERVEYDSRKEKVEFFNRAVMKSGADEVRGHYVSYDGITEQFFVTSTPGAKPGSPESRVRATIQPKSDKTATPAQVR